MNPAEYFAEPDAGELPAEIRALHADVPPPPDELAESARNVLALVPSGNDADVPRPFRTLKILQGEPRTPPSLLVDGLLLDEDINNGNGPGGSGKSTVMLHAAVCIALALPVFGTLRVHRPGPVLLVLPEDGEAAARMMLDAICAGMQLSEEQQLLLSERLHMIADDELVKITVDTRRLRDTALAHGAVLVILDPLRDLLGGEKESDNDVAGAVCAALRRDVCRGAHAAVHLNQHHRKRGKQDAPDAEPTIDDARGASAWINSARLAFTVSKRGDRITLALGKSNRIANGTRHEVVLTITADPENAAHWLTATLTDANAGATGGHSDAYTPGKGRPLNPNELRLLGCLEDTHEPGKRLSASAWLRDGGLNANTHKDTRRRLLDAGLADALPSGKKTRFGSPEYSYGITSFGRETLAKMVPKGERVSEWC